MIKHVVMWKIRDELDGKPKSELCRDIKQQLEALPGKIPVIRSLEVGINAIRQTHPTTHSDKQLTRRKISRHMPCTRPCQGCGGHRQGKADPQRGRLSGIGRAVDNENT